MEIVQSPKKNLEKYCNYYLFPTSSFRKILRLHTHETMYISQTFYVDKIYIKISGRCRLVVPPVGARDVRPVPHVSKLCEGRPAHTTQSKLTVPHLPACHLVVECHTPSGVYKGSRRQDGAPSSSGSQREVPE